jgi:hypothetical protein
MSADYLISEYASDPSFPGGQPPVLCQQGIGCGPAPSISQEFSQETNFISMRLGEHVPPPSHVTQTGIVKDRTIYFELGLDPLPTLVDKWRSGALGDQTLPVSNELVILPVGRGSRIAILGINMSSDPEHSSPTLVAA